jgi:hypothetical protein
VGVNFALLKCAIGLSAQSGGECGRNPSGGITMIVIQTTENLKVKSGTNEQSALFNQSINYVSCFDTLPKW